MSLMAVRLLFPRLGGVLHDSSSTFGSDAGGGNVRAEGDVGAADEDGDEEDNDGEMAIVFMKRRMLGEAILAIVGSEGVTRGACEGD